MEGTGTGENQSLVLLSELSFIHQLVIQLESQLKEQPPSSDIEHSKSIVSQLLFRTDKSIYLAKSFGLGLKLRQPASPPRSTSASPASGMSETAFRCVDDNDDNDNKKEVSKKRKTLPKWRSQVRVGSTGGVEGPIDDGHSWRKYGQKDILGAKHPRGYYRCTYRNSQGCMATKQVQRTDENPTVFDVIYQGNHTCINKCNARHGPNINSINNNNCSSNNNNNSNNMNNGNILNKQTAESSQEQEYLNSLKATLTVKTEGLGLSGSGQQEAQEYNSISFSFPSTPMESGHLATVSNSYFAAGGFLPSFTSSPATSESNYLPVSQCAVSGYDHELGGLGPFRKVDSDLIEVISAMSAATSTTNSPVGDVDLVFRSLDFDNNLQIDPSCFF